MTPEQQRIAIAKLCGFKDISLQPFGDPESGVGFYDYASGIPDNGGRAIPDYLNDLNAMHEAEKMLSYEVHQPKYVHAIKRCIMRTSEIGAADDYQTTTSTAAQRAEAFLRALNLWKDS